MVVDLNPFSKVVWKDPSYKRQYADLLKEASAVSFEAEYQMVRNGLREANVFHMSPRNFDEQIEKITNDGLVFLPILRSKVYSGFSHRHYPVDRLDDNTFVFGVVAESLDTAKRFKDASLSGDHVTQGLMLGYPECCTRFFTKVWKSGSLDPCYESFMNTSGDVDPRLNVMLRYFGIKIIPFFPCSFNCERAIEVSGVWELVMKCIDPDITDFILSMLSKPLDWDLYKGIIEVDTPLFRGIVNGYYTEERKVIRWRVQ